jgi:hypothetical protein
VIRFEHHSESSSVMFHLYIKPGGDGTRPDGKTVPVRLNATTSRVSLLMGHCDVEADLLAISSVSAQISVAIGVTRHRLGKIEMIL